MMRLPDQLLEPVGAGWALVGHAGYHRDANTGHGISDASRDAEVLAVSLDRARRDPSDERDAICRHYEERDALVTL